MYEYFDGISERERFILNESFGGVAEEHARAITRLPSLEQVGDG